MLGTHDSARSWCWQRETRSGGFELEIMSIDPDTPASLRPELRPGMRLVELQRRPLPASSAQPQSPGLKRLELLHSQVPCAQVGTTAA